MHHVADNSASQDNFWRQTYLLAHHGNEHNHLSGCREQKRVKAVVGSVPIITILASSVCATALHSVHSCDNAVAARLRTSPSRRKGSQLSSRLNRDNSGTTRGFASVSSKR